MSKPVKLVRGEGDKAETVVAYTPTTVQQLINDGWTVADEDETKTEETKPEPAKPAPAPTPTPAAKKGNA